MPIIAPVQPNPTSTASTGGILIAAMLCPRLYNTSSQAHRPERIALSVTGNPVGKVGAGTGKADHLPSSHILVSAVDRICEVAFLGILQQPHEEGLACDIVECNVTTFHVLQHLV